MRKKILAAFLSVMMCISFLVVPVSAEEPPLPPVSGLGWETDKFVGHWDKYEGAQKYFVCLYKNDVRINDANLSGLPGVCQPDVTSYDFTDLIKANGTGVYTFTVGALVNGSEDFTTTQSTSTGKAYSIPTYEINVTTAEYTMGRVAAKVSGSEVTCASEGANVTLFAEASRGYRFVEWKSSDVNVSTGSFTMPANNVTVEAVFEPFPAVSGLTWDTDTFVGSWNEYTNAVYYDVVLYKNGSMVKDPSTRTALPGRVENATSYDFTALIEANGDGDYKFTVAAYVDRDDDLNDTISGMSEAKTYDVMPNVTGITWDENSFTGSWTAYAGAEQYFVQLYKDGKRINNEYDTAQPGYVGNVTSYDFSNLVSANGEGTYTFCVSAWVTSTDDLVSTQSELSAGKKYSLATYTITVNTEGGNYFCTAASNPISADKGETITLTATAGMGYQFVEWRSSDVEISSDSFTMPDKDVTVTAVFAIKTYNVSFVMNGHGTAIDSQSVEEYCGVKEPPTPTESGWIFDGWYSDDKFTSEFNFATTIVADTVLYAKWKPEMVYTPDNSDTKTWTKGSTDSLEFIFHRAEDDSLTYSLFEGILVDGTPVSPDNYDAASGSLILKIKASYLETLTEGLHKLKVNFADGSVTVDFEIKLEPEPGSDPTPTPSPDPNPNPAPNPDPNPPTPDPDKPTPTPNPDPDSPAPTSAPNSPATNSPAPATGEIGNGTALAAFVMIGASILFGALGVRKKREDI